MKTDSVDWIYNEIHKKNVFNKYWWNHQITCSKLSYFFVTVHKSMIAEWDVSIYAKLYKSIFKSFNKFAIRKHI